MKKSSWQRVVFLHVLLTKAQPQHLLQQSQVPGPGPLLALGGSHSALLLLMHSTVLVLAQGLPAQGLWIMLWCCQDAGQPSPPRFQQSKDHSQDAERAQEVQQAPRCVSCASIADGALPLHK